MQFNNDSDQQQENRDCPDRRQQDSGPPKRCHERRKSPERRKSDIAEISYFEWASHFVKFEEKTRTESTNRTAEEASQVFGRARG